jgi:glycerol-3-phosphate O-acyltransferase/dihydroxyacetone phosphate acyltransferase
MSHRRESRLYRLTLIFSLTDLFTTPHERITSLKRLLATYHRLLISSRLSNAALTDLPLAKALNPRRKFDVPSRLNTLWILVKDSISSGFRLPFFFIPLLVHLPLYVVGVFGARLAEDEMETQAQMKVALGLVLSFLMYPVLFFSLWAVFRQVPLGAALAAGVLYLLQRYHSALIDENYDA